MSYHLFMVYVVTLPSVPTAELKRIKITVGFYDVINPQLSRELLAAFAKQYNTDVTLQPKVQVLPTTTYYKPRNR